MAACQMAGAKLSCSPPDTAGRNPGPSSWEESGRGWQVKSPSELAKEPDPESTELEGHGNISCVCAKT